MLLRTLSRWLLSISREGDYSWYKAMSVVKLQCQPYPYIRNWCPEGSLNSPGAEYFSSKGDVPAQGHFA